MRSRELKKHQNYVKSDQSFFLKKASIYFEKIINKWLDYFFVL